MHDAFHQIVFIDGFNRMLTKSNQFFIVFICSTAFLQASLPRQKEKSVAKFLQNPPSPLYQATTSFALSSTASTPLYGAGTSDIPDSPLCLAASSHTPIFALGLLSGQEQEARTIINANQEKDIFELFATQQSKKSAIIAKRKAQKEMNRQQYLIAQRLAAIQAYQQAHPGCKLSNTHLCPVTNELFYTKTGRTCINPDDLFLRT